VLILTTNDLANILDGQNLLIDIISSLHHQTQIHYGNELANLFRFESSVFTDRFDIKLAIPLIEQVVNNGPNESIYKAVSDLAAYLSFISPNTYPKVASDMQTSTSTKGTDSNSSESDDEPEVRAPKRAKLAHGDSNREVDYGAFGRKDDAGASNKEYCDEEPAIEEPPIFEYRPLDTARREIRLLVLHPGEDISSYSCSLIYVSMDEKPDYEALSYVWGSNLHYDEAFSYLRGSNPRYEAFSYLSSSEANKKKISINGKQLSVTANLAEALNHLYDSDHPRKLWVDAICINQKDTPERSQQV
jgi:Heterokaryon incompatibility protein (HET)